MSKKIILPAMYALVCTLLIVNCVRQIDFADSEADSNTFVISGGFSNTTGPHRIRFVRPDNYEGQFYRGFRGAKIELHDDLGNVYPYREVVDFDLREYWLENVTGEVGRTYWIEVEYQGTTFRSRPEKMLEPLPSDSIIFESRLVDQLGEFGSVTLQPMGFVYASSVIPEETKGRCVRWESEYVYIYYDRPCPTPFNPSPRKQCFVNNFVSSKTVGIANPARFQPGSRIKTLCGERKIDQAFTERCAINLYQRTISIEAYDYWEKVNQLINPTGTVFDVPPGRIQGNMDVVSGEKYEILGWFEVSSSSVSRVFKTRADLRFDVGSFAINPCYKDNVGCSTIGSCGDCLQQPYSTLQAPVWWQ